MEPLLAEQYGGAQQPFHGAAECPAERALLHHLWGQEQPCEPDVGDLAKGELHLERPLPHDPLVGHWRELAIDVPKDLPDPSSVDAVVFAVSHRAYLELDVAAWLGDARPDYGWLSEESEDTDARLDTACVWIVDPIDGTRAFLDGREEFSISVALTVDGQPVSAAVYNPATDEMFDAVAGGGTRLNGEPVMASDTRGLDGARLLMSRSELRRADWPRDLGECAMTPISSMAYKLALVAAGRFDATATLWPKSEWDIVAGDLLVREAGGRITDSSGTPFAYNAVSTRRLSVVAAAQGVFDPLIDRLGAYVAQPRDR